MQGDTLSPLLFILIIESIFSNLNLQDKPRFVNFDIGNEIVGINHLLYMDDIKLFSNDKESLTSLMINTITILNKISLEVNYEKCGTNKDIKFEENSLLRDNYKYLCIIEN